MVNHFGSWIWPKAGKVVKLTTNLKQFLCGSRTNVPPPALHSAQIAMSLAVQGLTFVPLWVAGVLLVACHASGQRCLDKFITTVVILLAAFGEGSIPQRTFNFDTTIDKCWRGFGSAARAIRCRMACHLCQWSQVSIKCLAGHTLFCDHYDRHMAYT